MFSKHKLLKFFSNCLIGLIVFGLNMSVSNAKPDLMQLADMQVLHQKNSVYEFEYAQFMQPAPEVGDEFSILQTFARPRYYQVWLAKPKLKFNNTPQSQNNVKHVLYVLDGNAVLDRLNTATLQSLALARVTKGEDIPAIVLIGYKTSYRFDVVSRAYDYTPPKLADFDQNHLRATDTFDGHLANNSIFQEKSRQGSGYVNRLNGGAEQFYQIIETQIKPWVNQKLDTESTLLPQQQNVQTQRVKQAIWGHSYGGLFVLYNLFKHPDAYDAFYSADPSLWWENGEIIKYLQAYQNEQSQSGDILKHSLQLQKSSTNKRLRLMFSENSLPHIANQALQNSESQSLMNKRMFADAMCQSFGEQCRYQFFNQTHGELLYSSWLQVWEEY